MKRLFFGLLCTFAMMRQEWMLDTDPKNVEKIEKFGKFIKDIKNKLIDIIFVIDGKAGNVEYDANYEAALDSVEYLVAYIFKSLSGREKYVRIGLIQEGVPSKLAQMDLVGTADYPTFLKTFSKISNETLTGPTRRRSNITSSLQIAYDSFNNRDIYKVLIILTDRSDWKDIVTFKFANTLTSRGVQIILFGGNHEIKIGDLDQNITTSRNIYLFTDFDNLYKSFFFIFKNDSDRLTNTT